MKTPIDDFVREYARGETVRMHMPGHKGKGSVERLDLTEIGGADSLFEADGIIAESERAASEIFGCTSFYSTEGSSLCIKAAVRLVAQYAAAVGKRPKIAAARGAHRAFLSAVSLLGVDVDWLMPESESYLCCPLTAEYLEQYLSCAEQPPTAVYLTSPDYLGNMADVEGISEVCHRRGALLVVDNAHGAYLKLLQPSRHPIDVGADMCCDSAHKTLPVLTGGAYLHVSRDCDPEFFALATSEAKEAMSIFGSSSPSYLILASLDRANAAISGDYGRKVRQLCSLLDGLRGELRAAGHRLLGDEPMKLSIDARSYGYRGDELCEQLRARGIEPEFADRDSVVLMPSPMNSESELERLREALLGIEKKTAINVLPPRISSVETVMSPAEAMRCRSETVDVEDGEGRVSATLTVACPPAVPIVVAGERVSREAVEAMKYYGIKKIKVIK